MEQNFIKFLEKSIQLEKNWGDIIRESVSTESSLLESFNTPEELFEAVNSNKNNTLVKTKNILKEYTNILLDITNQSFNEETNDRLYDLLYKIGNSIKESNDLQEIINYKKQITILRDKIISKIKY